ncbi:MAG: sigma-70 family RNA polymerase sigma factor [Steroidobacteraceae bacterium]
MASIAARAGPTDTARRMGSADIPGADEGDEALMLAYARGDAVSFERLYERHKGPTYRYLLRHTSDRASTDELHQDVWMRVVKARASYTPAARFTTWLYTLARHRLVDHWRSRRVAYVSLLDEETDCDVDDDGEAGSSAFAAGDDPLAATMNAQSGQRLLAALADVPGPQRDAFLLHVEAGLSLHEIASLVGVPAETIKSRLRYAYRRLRAALEDLQ